MKNNCRSDDVKVIPKKRGLSPIVFRLSPIVFQDELISQHPEYSRLGLTPEVRQSAYRELFNAHLEPQTLTEIRTGLNGELVTGTGRFKAEIEAMLGRKTQMGTRGRPRKSTDAYREGGGKHEQLSIEGRA